jgi:predicted dehydrogenase
MQLTVIGTKGTVAVGSGPPVVRDERGSESQIPFPAAVNPYALFANACAGRIPPAVTSLDGRAVLAGVLAAYESAATERTARLQHPAPELPGPAIAAGLPATS